MCGRKQISSTNSAYARRSGSVVGAASRDASTDRNPARSSRIIVVGTSANSQGSRQPREVHGEGGRPDQGLGPIAEHPQVRTATALRDEASARRERAVHAREHSLVIGHPVQGRRAEYGVERISKREGRAVGANETQSARIGGSVVQRRHRRPTGRKTGGFAKHRFRAVDADDVTLPHLLEQDGRQPGGAASEIEDAFPWPGSQTLHDSPAPFELRVRDGMVAAGIPIHELLCPARVAGIVCHGTGAHGVRTGTDASGIRVAPSRRSDPRQR